MSLWTSTVALALTYALAAPPPHESDVDVAVPPPAEATPDEADGDDLRDALLVEARKRYEDANELFNTRRYLEAAAEFERSYAAVQVGNTLYGVALSYEKGGNYVRALDAYQRYLELPDCPADGGHCAERRTEVEQTFAKLRGKVGRLSIVIDEGVELQGIEIDDRFIPPEDFPLILTPGRYELRVRGIRRGEVRTREVVIGAGEMTSLLIPAFDAPEPPDPTLELDREPPGDIGGPPPARVTEEERRRRLRIAFYGGVGATALMGIATGVVGGFTLKAYKKWDARCKGEGVDCSGTTRPVDAKMRFYQLKPVTNALVGVTAAVGLTTVVLGLFAFSDKRGASTRASVTRVTPSPGGLSVRF